MSQLIDSHVHFWDPNVLRYTWLENAPVLNRAYLTDHVPAQAVGFEIEGIVFVQADCAREQGLDETDFVTGLAQKDKRIRGIVAFAAVEEGTSVRSHLEALRTRPLVKGVRRLTQDEPVGFGVQPKFIAGVQLLAEYDLTFDLCIRHWQMGDAIRLVRACPDVQFVLDHSGKPDIKNHHLEPWRTQISELASLPNVRCKLSGLVTEADVNAWTRADLLPYIEQVVDAFGADRVMFGSDAPVAYLASTYVRWVETLHNALTGLSAADCEKIWYTNAKNFYRI